MKNPVTSWSTLLQAATLWLSSLPVSWNNIYSVNRMAITSTLIQRSLILQQQSSNCSWAGRSERFSLWTTTKSSKTSQKSRLRSRPPKIDVTSSSWTDQTGTCALHARYFRSVYAPFSYLQPFSVLIFPQGSHHY